MRIKVLGCSGGIGGDLRTTGMLVDEDILIDAGTGVGDLLIEQLVKIDHVFVTHSHLDHVTSIPFLVDTVCWMRDRPLTVYSTAATIQILKEHLFNWKIWPDFSQIPDAEKPVMVYREILVGETIDLDGRKFTAIPAVHTVPAVGYLLDSGQATLIFSGDTTHNDALWDIANRAKPGFDVRECCRPVERWFARTEEVEIGSVQDGDSHFFLRPSSHAVNCSMSASRSSASAGCSTAASDWVSDEAA